MSDNKRSECISRDGVNRIVVCFDRDYTVSVNPHPTRKSVPLWWVTQLAHQRPRVDVWATGNQMLTIEASIHGTVYTAAVWQHIHQQHPSDVYPSERDDYYKPSREARLRVIQDCYEHYHSPENLALLVVDDADLSTMEEEGWRHYTAWEFVSAVADGEFDFFDPDSVDDSNEELSVDHRYSLERMSESVSLPNPPENLRDDYETQYKSMSRIVERLQ